MLRPIDAVDAVVGAHHGPRLRQADGRLECRQIDLAEGSLVDLGADGHPPRLLVVHGEVLERRPDPVRLNPVDPGGRELPRDDRVLGEVLEVAAAQRAALHVDAGAEDDVHAEGDGLAGDGRAHLAGEIHVPRGRQARCGGEARGVVGTEGHGAGIRSPADPVRTVGDADRREADSLDRRRGPGRLARAEGGLLLERQRGETSCGLLVVHRSLIRFTGAPAGSDGDRGHAGRLIRVSDPMPSPEPVSRLQARRGATWPTRGRSPWGATRSPRRPVLRPSPQRGVP